MRSYYGFSTFLILVWMSLWALLTLIFIHYHFDVLTFALFLDVEIEACIVIKLYLKANPDNAYIIFHLCIRALSLLCLSMARYVIPHNSNNNDLAEIKLIYYTSFLSVLSIILYIRKLMNNQQNVMEIHVDPIPHVIIVQGTMCTICAEVIENTDTIYNLRCQHIFHTSCLEPWLERSQTCPNCRVPIQSNV